MQNRPARKQTLPLGLRNQNQSAVRWAQVERLRLLAQGQDVAPVTFDVDPVNYCNHSCNWCLDAEHGNSVLPLEQIRCFAEELSQFTVNGTRCEGLILKGGGEPTLHPEFADVVRVLGTTGCDLGLITNGSRLDRVDIQEAIQESISFVRVSLDACRPDSHAAGHHSNDFERITAGVKLLTRSRSGEYPVVGLTFILRPATAGDLDLVVPLAEELGVDYLQLRLAYGEEVGNDLVDSSSNLRSLHAAMLRLRGSSDRVSVYVSDYLPEHVLQDAGTSLPIPIEHRLGSCRAHVLTAVLTADRWVFGCCEHRNLPEYRLGRLDYPQTNLQQIWGSEHRARILERMTRAECLPYCTHPVSTYNEAIEEIRGSDSRAASFS